MDDRSKAFLTLFEHSISKFLSFINLSFEKRPVSVKKILTDTAEILGAQFISLSKHVANEDGSINVFVKRCYMNSLSEKEYSEIVFEDMRVINPIRTPWYERRARKLPSFLTEMGLQRCMIFDPVKIVSTSNSNDFGFSIDQQCLVIGWAEAFDGEYIQEFNLYTSYLTRWISTAALVSVNHSWTMNRIIGENKDLKNALIRASDLEGIALLAGDIAHDFNNLLHGMSGNLELLPENIKKESHCSEIEYNMERAKDLIGDILTVLNSATDQLKEVKIKNVVERIVLLMKNKCLHNIQISSEEVCDKFVLANETKLYRVLLNLCTNAEESLKQSGGKIVLSAKSLSISEEKKLLVGEIFKNEYVKILVKDTGSGIDPMKISKIFEPDYTTKTDQRASGFGLKIVKNAVLEYGGAIDIESDLGVGSTFIIYFPVCGEPIKENIKQNNLNEFSGNERILFVDDEVGLVNLGLEVLERGGYSVGAFTDSGSALTEFQNNYEIYDLVITDMSMPNINGAKLAAQIKLIRKDMPIIICTGNSAAACSEELGLINDAMILEKPYSSTQLYKLIREVLDKPGPCTDN